MLQWLVDLLWSVLVKLGQWLLSIIVWCFEWLYELVGGGVEYLADMAGAIITKAMDGILEFLPDGWAEHITAVYPYLEYVDSWFPVSYGLKLFIAYYGLKAVMIPVKWTRKAIPGMGA